MLRDLPIYVDLGGAPTRRGRFVPPDPPDILIRTLDDLTVANPISAADFRYAIGDSTFGDLATQRALMQVVNFGGAEGKGIRITLPATYYTGGNTGVAFSNIKLSRRVEGISQKFRQRFGAGFETAKGGKCGPGIGGWAPTSAPVAGFASPTTPPSGGNTTPYSWSVRPEWGADGKIHEICYLPYRTNYSGATVYGIGRSLAISAHVKGTFFDYERQIILNDTNVTDTTRDPRTLVQGTVNAFGIPNGDGDYYANGIHRVYVDDVLAYEKTNEIFRYYKDADCRGFLWSYFRGGGDSTWSATTAGSYFDLASHQMVELAA